MQTKTFNVYNHENQAVQDAYSMLAANIHLKDGERKIKSVVLTSCKPSVGKTTLAISLGITMAQSGWKVLLVDADMRKPSEAKRLNSDEINGLSEYLSGDVELQDALCKTNVKNLTYFSCGKNHPNPIGLLCSARFDEMIAKARNVYDFIIFDTPALATVADGSLVAAKSDATMLVVEIGSTNLLTLRRAKQQLEKVNANTLGVVLNKVRKRDYKEYFESYNYFFNTEKFLNMKMTGKAKITTKL
ncbi:MAG: CpsD/CapB family tyrosine-protein kinase [Clostridia bacterium]|nr:CpsD/CapB family tyrosine-protein kinase [Clostridia bacterium]